MGRNWMEFEDGPTMADRNAIYATMNDRGEIIINRRAFEEMERPEAVVMLFDPNTDTIGLRPTSPLMQNAFPVKPKGSCGHRLIRAKPFAARHDMRLDGTVRFRTAAVEDGILILELRAMVRVTGASRKGIIRPRSAVNGRR